MSLRYSELDAQRLIYVRLPQGVFQRFRRLEDFGFAICNHQVLTSLIAESAAFQEDMLEIFALSVFTAWR